jgi:hypothetical protein
LDMASAKEIEKELAIALKEVGKIQPWFDAELNDWVFSSNLYPVECGGNTAEEVAKKYPLYLKEFITQRLNKNLDPFVEKKTKGHGGRRPGAGRPKEAKKEVKSRIYLPLELAKWLQDPKNLRLAENLRQKHC